jgi:hypothetical protein
MTMITNGIPKQLTLPDCCGRNILFDIYIRPMPDAGYGAHANEVKPNDEVGYVFESAISVSPLSAYSDLLAKIKTGISKKFLQYENHEPDMSANELQGHIDHRGMVVDGVLLDFEAFVRMLLVYEGSRFTLKIEG